MQIVHKLYHRSYRHLRDFSFTFPLGISIIKKLKVGTWLSLVEHSVRDAGVAGSNPVVPTIKLNLPGSALYRLDLFYCPFHQNHCCFCHQARWSGRQRAIDLCLKHGTYLGQGGLSSSS